MEILNEKKALAIELPIKPNSQSVITLMTNQKATTSVRRIAEVVYNESYLFVTIETKNSIYKDIPIPVQPQDNFCCGQIVSAGKKVITSDGYYIDVMEVMEITESGIVIKDTNNREYVGAIYPIVYQ